MVALLVLGTIAPLSAQNLVSSPRTPEISNKADDLDGNAEQRFGDATVLLGKYEVPALVKAKGNLPDGKPVYSAQDSLTLNARTSSQQSVESVVDLNVLRNPSPYRKVAVSTQAQPYKIAADSLQNGLALISAVYRESGKSEKARIASPSPSQWNNGSSSTCLGCSKSSNPRLEPIPPALAKS